VKQRLKSTLQSTAAEQTSSAVFAFESPGRNRRSRIFGQESQDKNPDRESLAEQTGPSLCGFTSRRQCNVFRRKNMPLELGRAHPALVYDGSESGCAAASKPAWFFVFSCVPIV
jgi:hypothetical protein